MKTRYLAVTTTALLSALLLGSIEATAEPKTNLLHQWADGSDAAAIAKLGEMYTAAGGTWQQTPISGHTVKHARQLRADVFRQRTPGGAIEGP
jgi:glucose/mannose transport system substrate-binding protein